MHSSCKFPARLSLLPSHGRSAILFLLAQIFQIQTSLAWSIITNFGNYPSCAQPCLLAEAIASGCPDTTITTAAVSNACLCSSITFLRAIAICTNTRCGSGLTGLVWDTGDVNCRSTGSGIGISRPEFIALTAQTTLSTISPSTKIITSTQASSSIPPVTRIITSTSPVTRTTAIEPSTTIPSRTSASTPSSASTSRSSLTKFLTSTPKDSDSTAAPSSTPSKPLDVNIVDSPHYSRSEKIALGVGIGFGIPAVIFGILMLRKKWVG